MTLDFWIHSAAIAIRNIIGLALYVGLALVTGLDLHSEIGRLGFILTAVIVWATNPTREELEGGTT